MTTDAVGGVWSYALTLCRGLLARQVRVTLAVLGPPPGATQRLEAAAIPGLRLLDTGLMLDWMVPDAAAVRDAGGRLAALARDCGADLLHLNSPALAAGNRFPIPVLAFCHSCMASWWAAVRSGPLPSDFTWHRDLLAEGYRVADLVAAPSAAFAAATQSLYGLPERPRLVFNGTAPWAMRGASPTPFFAFTAGRLWDEGKNLATLDAAAAQLPFPLLAAGPVEGPGGARIDLRHLQTQGSLDRAAMQAMLARQPAFVSAARYEPFGLAVLEAAQAGCPLVLSDIPTFREIWGGAADYVASGDAAGFAAALRRLAAPRLRQARGEAARRRAARYTADAMVTATLDLYRELVPARAFLETPA
ncbi:glycosyltransferase family 4 protein [Teichococcus oryzae]|uniref:glycosyltransferase family 4 protein n=1 Tax=Teichococcus oryzae TaxID=1608942 RepID=UPI001F4F7AB6|nr:glycosyltransferase family 4 protein [Pseudoroseomonas oryzae]